MHTKIKIKVVGSNINRFILKLHQKKINIYHIYKKNNDCCYLIVNYNDFDNIIKYKTIYDVEIVEYLGVYKLKNNIIKNKFYLLILVLAFLFVFFITRFTFNIKVVTNDQKMHNLIIKELKKEGIYKYAPLRNYNYITKVKNNIMQRYPKLFEWLEIKKEGTSYIIRFEERIENNQKEDDKIYDIIAAKDSRIINLDITSGQIIKNINDYVKKGDVIVSSDIKLNEEIKNQISAKGNVYGEVWYKASITIPNNYVSKTISGKSVKTYSLNFLSFKILFNKSSFSDKIVLSKDIIKNRLFPISFNKEEIKEVIIDKKTSKEKQAIKLGIDKISTKLKDNEEIIDYFVIDKKQNENDYTLNMFISVKENITEYVAR